MLSPAHWKPGKPWRHCCIQAPSETVRRNVQQDWFGVSPETFPCCHSLQRGCHFSGRVGNQFKAIFLFCPLPPFFPHCFPLPFPMSFLSSFCFVFELSTPWRFLCITHISSLKNISSPGQPLNFPFKHVTKMSSI